MDIGFWEGEGEGGVKGNTFGIMALVFTYGLGIVTRHIIIGNHDESIIKELCRNGVCYTVLFGDK